MFIQTQGTPNPNAMMFLPGQDVMGEGGGTAVFSDIREAAASPLARSLFQVDGVIMVFYGADYISVTIIDKEWEVVKPDIFACIMDFYHSGQPLVLEGAAGLSGADTEILDTDDEVVMMIKELLDTRIRPSVQEDGGDIAYRGFENGEVLLQLQGACSGCPSSQATLKGGIEGMLMHYIPEVEGVREVFEEESSAVPLSFEPQPVDSF
jgi:Fe-S cluster biogenesis protein NfuA